MHLHGIRKIIYVFWVVVINFIIACSIFLIAEIGYRIYCDGGIRSAFANISGNFLKVPYSNLGTHNWVIADDILGYRLNPNKGGINNLSMREKEVTIPKPKGVYRIVFLGDSLVWSRPGIVSYTAQMLDEHRNIEVLNASVPGYTTYQEMMFLEKYVIKTSPDLVVLTYCLNDNYKFLHRFDSKGGMLRTPEAEESLKINTWVDSFVSKSYLLSNLKLILIGRKQEMKGNMYPWEKTTDFNIAWKDYSWVRFENYLAEIKRVLASKNSKLCVVVIPYRPQLNPKLLALDYEYVLKPQKKLMTLCEKYGLPFLDLFLPIYNSKNNGADLYRDTLHLNDTGQRLAAKYYYRLLYTNYLYSMGNRIGTLLEGNK